MQDHSADYYVSSRYKGMGLKYHSRVINEMMRGVRGKILDVGCGTGIIHDLYPNLDIMGIDVSQGMLAHHKGKHKMASACNIPFRDDKFDSVVCRSVLHHIPETEKALKEIKRVLKPGGSFVCWETNKSWLAEMVRGVTQHGDRFSEYHHSFSNLPELINQYFGDMVVEYQGFVGYPLYGFPDILDFSRYLHFLFEPCMVLDKLLSKIPVINQLAFAVMVRATKEE